ncbi:hypothetical protein EN780_05745 [Mesorhizobium sp. M4B.F.Ca.ET.089.01.1.1]|uniref:hypothetical protein n=1 Tax=Mesorhizobium sp. M4B.F.Ca.ET.089.01.1.1 TaxID=2496662 RepID=UPI000FE2BA9F|nr:hypothetical protein [Mesorhizobium sp. M4B.F.Ca.ET.089.01.1.1]RWX69625.1 hypothetical protein EN780_05745 [Mesorhizobium sp. M4B.F.Ca.ET.089.01.1.1]
MSLFEPTGLPEWKWPRMPVYNGFTHEERVRGWQLIHHFIDNGWLAKAKRCSISGSTENIQAHCENYYSPWSPYPVSRSIHMVLHRRFRQPNPWKRILEMYTVTGQEWFSNLSLEPIDLAAILRAKHGPGIADVFCKAQSVRLAGVQAAARC